MKSTTETRMVRGSPEEVFDYLADFTSCAVWDPSVVAATRLDDGPIGVGTRFDVRVRFAGRELPMAYRIDKAERPRALELHAISPSSTARDRIRFESAEAGFTRVTWSLEVQLTGWSRVAEPFMGPMLRRLGREALGGLVAARA